MGSRLILDLGSKRVGIWSFLPRMQHREVMALGWLRWSGRKCGRSQQVVLYRTPAPHLPQKAVHAVISSPVFLPGLQRHAGPLGHQQVSDVSLVTSLSNMMSIL